MTFKQDNLHLLVDLNHVQSNYGMQVLLNAGTTLLNVQNLGHGEHMQTQVVLKFG